MDIKEAAVVNPETPMAIDDKDKEDKDAIMQDFEEIDKVKCEKGSHYRSPIIVIHHHHYNNIINYKSGSMSSSMSIGTHSSTSLDVIALACLKASASIFAALQK